MGEGSQETPNSTSPTTDGQATQRDPIDAIATRVLQSLLQSVTSLQPGGLPASSTGSAGTAPESQGGTSTETSANGASGKPAQIYNSSYTARTVGRNLKYSTKYNPRISRLQPYQKMRKRAAVHTAEPLTNCIESVPFDDIYTTSAFYRL